MKHDEIYPKNGKAEDYDNMSRTKVKREDGLATIDDLADMMDKKTPDEKEAEQKDADSKDLGEFIELIIKIKK